VNTQGSFWAWRESTNINTLGFIIAAIFAATWMIALAIWRLGSIEKR
jgi:nickel/cobalt transporter (NiCoT) family protein